METLDTKKTTKTRKPRNADSTFRDDVTNQMIVLSNTDLHANSTKEMDDVDSERRASLHTLIKVPVDKEVETTMTFCLYSSRP